MAHDNAVRDRWIDSVIQREGPRLKSWLKRHAPSADDVEDILQDAFCELAVAYRLTTPIQHAGAWLYRVVRNRLTDLFRKSRTVSLDQSAIRAGPQDDPDGAPDAQFDFGEYLPDPAAGPDHAYAWAALIVEMEDVLADLPAAQRDVFMAHEIDGKSFNEIALATGESVNTLLARKHGAVLALRRRLRDAYDDASQI